MNQKSKNVKDAKVIIERINKMRSSNTKETFDNSMKNLLTVKLPHKNK